MNNRYSRLLLGMALSLGTALMAGPVLAQTTVAGTTPGQFSVNESGAATYSIPIQVPPGVAGMQPQLSFRYNSQGGNGLLGMGWSLNGLSSITRCPKTMAQDGVRGGVNYDMNDRYCMDGQRLVLASGTYGAANSEYRTEQDSFSKITAYGNAGNGPAYFIVQTKAGLTVEYGNTADSRVEAQGKTTARLWAVNRIQDVKANYLTVSYSEANATGETYVSSVDYTGSSASTATPYSVKFLYETRPDVSGGVLGYSVYRLTQRLTGIKTYNNLAVVKDYRLTYQQSPSTSRSRLLSLKECDGQSVPACLPPVDLTWNNSVNGEIYGTWNDSTNLPGAVNSYTHELVDVNGDGLPDLVQIARGSASGWISINPGDGGFRSWTYTTNLTGAANSYVHYFTDVNGDGLPDLVQVSRYTTGIWVSINPGDGNFQTWTYSSGLAGSANDYSSHFVDVNGDGRADFVHMSRTTNALHISINPGNGNFQSWNYINGMTGAANDYDTHFVDVNGDGLVDLVHMSRSTNSGYIGINPGNGFYNSWDYLTSLPGPAAAYASYFVDVNGDGLADFVTMSNSTNALYVSINGGNGNFQAWSHYTGLTGPANDYDTYFTDINGDGLVDLVHVAHNTNQGYISLNPGNGYFNTWIYSSNLPGAANSYLHRFVDINGDGLPDLFQIDRGTNFAWISRTSTNIADFLSTVAQGSGSTTSLTYQPLTKGTIYTKDSGVNAAVYPKVDLQYPQYVVSTVSTSNGLGGVNTVQYNYGGLKAEQGTGRGLLGFRWMKSKSVANNIESYTEFNQTYPFTGSVTKNETRLTGSGNAGLLKRTTNTYAQSPGSAGASVFVYPSQSVEESWDLSGTPYPGSTTSYVYGQNPQYGDPTQITVSNSEGSSKATVNEYWPVDTNNWILGRLKKASVTSVKP